MKQVNIHEAKTNLSQLVEAALAGEQVVIARAGKPAVQLVPYRQPGRRRKLGAMKGRIRIADDFDAPLPDEIVAGFLGKTTD
jgi:prevent-host-death family protein